jgi:phage shock protein C
MPAKKTKKAVKAKAVKARRPVRVATHEERVEHFAEEMGTLGRRATQAARNGGIKRLYRSGREKILGGVCGGIAEYFRMDPSLVRIAWILISLAWGVGVLAYLIAWIIIPRNPRHKW